MNNPIIVIQSSEKLNSENFVKWKSNVNIVLICENYKFIFTEECPPEPVANTPRTVREAYDRWIQANNKAGCYMLAPMSDVLRIKCEKTETALRLWSVFQKCLGNLLTSHVMMPLKLL